MLRRFDEFVSDRLSTRVAMLSVITLVIACVLVDAFSPADIIVPIGFAIPIALCAWARRPYFLWIVTATVVVLTFSCHFLHTNTPPNDQGFVLLNRILVAIVLIVVAAVVNLRDVAGRNLEEERQAVETQNVELAKANTELEQREEEIVRQNEELQSQTEELERQSEELRVTNEELAQWEKMLEQLLDLSRSLTTELSRSDTVNKICETLGLLMGDTAAAILEKQGDDVKILCHHKFGPDGTESDTIPLASSFSSLVISLGQTGYLEDLSLRPDLVVPQPKHGSRHRAVISTPVRMHGRCVGTIEAYSATPRIWTESQIAMIESLAAQTSISLQSAELVDAIKQERERFEAAFRTVPIGMAVAEDPSGRRVRLNPAAAAMLNLPVDENISTNSPAGRRIMRSISRAGQPVQEHEMPITRALNGQEVHGFDFEFALPDGKRLFLLGSASPFFDAQDGIAGAVAAYVDITQYKRLQHELEIRRREADEASARKTRFLAAVSHDIRTPANAITLLAELIGRTASQPGLTNQVPELATKLLANTRALMELVGDLLDITRFDSGRVELVESEFSLGELINNECEHVRMLAQEKGLELRFEPLKVPIWLRTDRVKLGRILGNLIGNAIKFTEAGSIRVLAGIQDHGLVIRVIDTGIGIEAENVDRIFDEFAQLRNPERDRAKGSGLGLAICKRLVEAMDGTITVASDFGRGTVFEVVLKRSSVVLRLDATLRQELPKHDSPSGTQPAVPLNVRVLLVEDHHSTREGTRRILVSEGATVLEAVDGKTALRILREEEPDAILLDMMLPGLDGREVLRAIQADRPPGLKCVLVLTGDLTAERLEEIKELGADGLIPKPVDIRKIVTALRECIVR